ncbi:MAG: hypothetical protein QOK29_2438 [Rhodospirillaceae bacterium]|nr:hypothetical protein [Rhodospirillaceae bacterium]
MRVDRHASHRCEPAPTLNSAGGRERRTSDKSANGQESPGLLSRSMALPSASGLSQRAPQLLRPAIAEQIRAPDAAKARAKAPSPGGPGILTFDPDKIAYDADRHAVQFPASDGRRGIICEISLAALMSLAAADRPETKDESLIAMYRRLGAKIRKIAQWKYLAGSLEPDGRILVATADLHGRCDQPPKI